MPNPMNPARIAQLIVLVAGSFVIPAQAQSQTDGIDTHIRRLDAQIAQAAAEQNYAAAAGLQRDRANWVDLKHAIEMQDAARILSLQDALAHPYVYEARNTQPASGAPTGNAGPEFMNQVYTLEADGSYRPLEKQEGNRSSSGGGYGGFGGRVSSLKVMGDRSNVRFARPLPRFVVKTYPGQDPSDLFELVRFEVRGVRKDRYVDMNKSSHAWYHHSSSEVTENRVLLAFKNIGDQVYEIVLDGTLDPGEYGFLLGDKVFAFGMNE